MSKLVRRFEDMPSWEQELILAIYGEPRDEYDDDEELTP